MQHTDGQQRQEKKRPEISVVVQMCLLCGFWRKAYVKVECVLVVETTQRAGVSTWNKAGRFLSLSLCLLHVCAAGVRCRPLTLQMCVPACVRVRGLNADCN